MNGVWLTIGAVASLSALGAPKRGSGAIEKRQREFLEKRARQLFEHAPEHQELHEKLLSLGGEMVVPMIEEDLKPILARGELLDPTKFPVEFMEGEASQCHANACRMWEHEPDLFQIWTGWALSPDGLWRQHTWVLEVDDSLDEPVIIETTEPRDLYFGFGMTHDEAANFAGDNW